MRLRRALKFHGLGWLMKSTFLLFAIVLTSVVCSCASLDPAPDYDRASRHVETAIGVDDLYRPEVDADIQQRIHAMLEDGLSAEEAVRICLLNNPRIQAALFRIGVSRADFVQSGLLSNPSLSFAPRWPDGGGLANLQLGMAQNIAELWQIPFRRRAARQDLERVILEVAREASLLGLQTRAAYYRAQRADELSEIAAGNVHVTEQLVKITIGRRDAGAGNETDVTMAKAQHADARLGDQNAALEVIEARAQLAELLGLGQSATDSALVDKPYAPSASEVPADTLIATAQEQRLDLRAARMAVEVAAARVAFEKSRFIRSLEIGVTAERNAQWDKNRGGGLSASGTLDIDQDSNVTRNISVGREAPEPQKSEWVVGPTFSMEAPIFDQNQAQIARAEFMQRQALKLVEAINCDVVQQAHIASARLRTMVDNVRLVRDELVPLRERALSLSEDGYRAGRTTFLTALEAQRALLEARAKLAEAIQNQATAFVEVERVAGCPITRIGISTTQTKISDGAPSADSGDAAAATGETTP